MPVEFEGKKSNNNLKSGIRQRSTGCNAIFFWKVNRQTYPDAKPKQGLEIPCLSLNENLLKVTLVKL